MPIRDTCRPRRAAGLVMTAAVLLAGCDYWPPALQTQIEQLRSELQTVTMEKAQLQNQMTSLTKADDLQMQVDDLSRTNRDKSTLIASLQSSVSALQSGWLNHPNLWPLRRPCQSDAEAGRQDCTKSTGQKKTLTKSAVH